MDGGTRRKNQKPAGQSVRRAEAQGFHGEQTGMLWQGLMVIKKKRKKRKASGKNTGASSGNVISIEDQAWEERAGEPEAGDTHGRWKRKEEGKDRDGSCSCTCIK